MAYLDMRLGQDELGEVAGDQHIYFLKMASTLCRQIGAQNSDAYLRCLIILSQAKTNSEEDTAELHRYTPNTRANLSRARDGNAQVEDINHALVVWQGVRAHGAASLRSDVCTH
jgi:hypothetical protein